MNNEIILFSGPRTKGHMIKQGREIKGSETCEEYKWELVGRRISKGGLGREIYLLQRKSGSPLSWPRGR